MAEYNVDSITYGGNTYQFPAIDDTAGSGDTDKTWSANKMATELAKKIGGNKRVWYGTAEKFGGRDFWINFIVTGFDSLQTGDVFHIIGMPDCYTDDSDVPLSVSVNAGSPATGYYLRTVTGSNVPANEHLFETGSSATFVFNGTHMILLNASKASTGRYGVTKLENSSSSSSTTTALVPAALKSVVDNRIAPLETSVAGKADKDTDAVEGNFAAFDSSGNPVDSGHKHSDYITSHQDISGKADKVSGATSGNFAGLDSNGNLTDSGKSASDFLETSAIDDTAGTGDTDKVWSADKLANENTLTKTITTPAAIQTFTDGAEWPMEMEIAVEPVQSGSGDPSPSNVRPITGWDGANVSVTDENLFDEENATKDYYINASGTIVASNPNDSTAGGEYSELISVIPGEKYILYYKKTYGSTWNTRVHGYDSNGTWIRQIAVGISLDNKQYFIPITIPSDVNKLRISANYQRLTAIWFGKGVNYTTSFPSTSYGGTLTVNADGTGTLVVDRALRTFTGANTESWLVHSTIASWFYMDDALPGAYYDNESADFCISNKYVQNTYLSVVELPNGRFAYGLTTTNKRRFVIKDTSCLTEEQFRATLASTNLQVCYKLATPITYTLSAPQVLSLLGQNNVWADCGNVNSLSYVRRQDIGFIRDNTAGQIRAATNPIREELGDAEAAMAIVIDGDTAPKAITSGQYLFVKNHSTLATGAYHATADIASGANVTGNNTSPDADGIANKVRDNFLISNNSTYVSIATSYNINDSFTAPEDGIYLIQTAGDDNSTGIWYTDSQRTKPIIANRNALSLAVPVPLKKGTTIYSRNVSGTAYYIYGYYKFK